MTLKSHTAAGQAAGYLFQPERGLLWLASSPAGSTVGIETEDDVVVRLRNGESVHEQVKHTIRPTHVPFSDRSKDLWNTLAIWVKAVDDKQINLQSTSLYLTTNALLPDCIVKRLSVKNPKLDEIISDLRANGAGPTEAIRASAKVVLAWTDAQLKDLFKRVRIADATTAASGESLRAEVASLLHLPEDMAWGDLLDNLGGWIHSQILDSWRSGRPAIITRDAFDTQYHRLLAVHRMSFKLAKPEHLVPVTLAEIDKLRDAVFVRQLRATNLRDAEGELTGAIHDFIRCCIEQFRLSKEGDLTADDIKAFANNLLRQWRAISRECAHDAAATGSEVDERDIGYSILSKSLKHREPLGGTHQEPYVTCGHFHRLANNLDIRWNLKFEVDSKFE